MGNKEVVTTLPESTRKRIEDAIFKILEIPGHEVKKISAHIENEAGRIEAVVKLDLSNLNIEIHRFIHNHFIRSDAINNNTNSRDLHYRIPDRYLEDVTALDSILKKGGTEAEVNKVLDSIDSKTAAVAAADKK